MAEVRKKNIPPDQFVDWVGLHGTRYKTLLDGNPFNPASGEQEKQLMRLIPFTSSYGSGSYMRKGFYLINKRDALMRRYAVPAALDEWKSIYGVLPRTDEELKDCYDLAKKKFVDLFYYKLTVPFISDGLVDFSKFRIYSSQDASRFALGKKEASETLTWFNWPRREMFIRAKKDFIPHSYIYAWQGAGKTNILKNFIHDALNRNYWVYTNLYIRPSTKKVYRHIYHVENLSDLFIDGRVNGEFVPSLWRGIAWMRQQGIVDWSAVLALDERGEGMEEGEVPQTKKARWTRQIDQVSRHIRMPTIEAGKQEKSTMLEQMVNMKIYVKNRRIAALDEQGEQRGVRSLQVSYRAGVVADKEFIETVDEVPLSGLRIGTSSSADISAPFDVDFSFTIARREVDINNDDALQVARDFSAYIMDIRRIPKHRREWAQEDQDDLYETEGVVVPAAESGATTHTI